MPPPAAPAPAHWAAQVQQRLGEEGWRVANQLRTPAPRWELTRLLPEGEELFCTLTPTGGKPAFAAHHNVALRYQGQHTTQSIAPYLNALKNLLPVLFPGPFPWDAWEPDTLAQGLMRLRAEKDWWFLTVPAACAPLCCFCERTVATTQTVRLKPWREQADALRQQMGEEGIPAGARVRVGGNEPLAWEGLVDLLEALRDMGLRPFALDTVAWPLTAQAARRLAGAGIEAAGVPLYSHLPDVHDRISRWRGAWEQAVAGVGLLQEAGVKVGLHTLALRQNAAHLGETLTFMAGLHPTRVFAFWPKAVAVAAWMSHDFLPPLEGLRSGLQDLTWKSPVPLRLFLPPCVVPPALAPHLDAMSHAPAHAAFCQGCAHAATCPGPGADYETVHGADFAP